METEQRLSRKRRKLTTRQGVVIGVATVAGLGLVSKLVSFLRREKPNKVADSDIHSLEAVVSGDAAKGVLSAPQFANLEEDDAHDAERDDGTPDLDANPAPTSHFKGEENGVTPHPSDNGPDDAGSVQLRKEKEGWEHHHHSEDGVVSEPPLGNTEQEAHHANKEVEELPVEDAETVPSEDVGKLPTEDVEKLPTAEVQQLPKSENGEKPHVEHHLPENERKLDEGNRFQVEDAEELPIEQGTHSVEAHREKQVNSDVEKHGTDDTVKPSFKAAAADADRIDTVEDASEFEVKDTERLHQVEDERKHESEEAHRVDEGKNLKQNGEILQS